MTTRNVAIALLVLAGLAGVAYMMRGKLAAGALHLLQRFEGRENRAYKDSAGIWTIGIGHKVLPTELNKYVGTPQTLNGKPRGSIIITDAEIDRLAAQDTATAAAHVKRLVKVPIDDNQQHALLSFAFNLGGGALQESTLLSLLNAKDYAGAAAQFPRWNKARVGGVLQEVPGLTARRLAEKTLFESGVMA